MASPEKENLMAYTSLSSVAGCKIACFTIRGKTTLSDMKSSKSVLSYVGIYL